MSDFLFGAMAADLMSGSRARRPSPSLDIETMGVSELRSALRDVMDILEMHQDALESLLADRRKGGGA